MWNQNTVTIRMKELGNPIATILLCWCHYNFPRYYRPKDISRLWLFCESEDVYGRKRKMTELSCWRRLEPRVIGWASVSFSFLSIFSPFPIQQENERVIIFYTSLYCGYKKIFNMLELCNSIRYLVRDHKLLRVEQNGSGQMDFPFILFYVWSIFFFSFLFVINFPIKFIIDK